MVPYIDICMCMYLLISVKQPLILTSCNEANAFLMDSPYNCILNSQNPKCTYVVNMWEYCMYGNIFIEIVVLLSNKVLLVQIVKSFLSVWASSCYSNRWGYTIVISK